MEKTTAHLVVILTTQERSALRYFNVKASEIKHEQNFGKFITTIIHIILILCLPSLSVASDIPKQKSFIVMDGSCCGGEESDPHAVHGIQTESGAFVLSGKIIDGSGYEDGFIVKVPQRFQTDKSFFIMKRSSI